MSDTTPAPIHPHDREADGAVDRDADVSFCAQLQPILEYIRDNVTHTGGGRGADRDADGGTGTETDADA
jgi:hypothetical protein